ncbi:insulin growth factor-like family member 3 isoform X2 [Phascolarctos cinereus]|uniref:Insulin growth factor-like family member 3 isoform X2 n=1 Tax=Phascolarctos cinereus TaxID=38626 RepID=A0A6P5JT57_PHACI|nr:insulin growth factor-like family member 3 isoform X2 [Phascolarctos cinereus]
MASRTYITVIVSIFFMVILSCSSAPVTPTDSQVIVCQPWLLCGTVAYNPQENQCCEDGSVQPFPLSCGPTFTYDPCFQHCCPDSYRGKYTVVNKTRGGTERSDCEMAVGADIRWRN